jgi:hypothetical protein
MKKLAIVMVMACLFGALLAQQCLAAQMWANNVTIKATGPANGTTPQVSFLLNSPDWGGTDIWVYTPSSDADANKNLAVALTAIANSKTVTAFTDWTNGGALGKLIINATP